MAKLREIIAALERLAPLKLQDEWDNSGLQVGFPDAEVSRVLVCLDVTEAVVEEAVTKPTEAGEDVKEAESPEGTPTTEPTEGDQ